MLMEGQSGPQSVGDGAINAMRLLKDSSAAVSDAHGRYQEAIYRGNVYSASVAGANTTGAWPLGAAGTPLLAIWNPPGSGKILVVLQTAIAVRNNGTVSPGSFAYSGGPTATITGTASVPLNLYSLQTTGSIAKFYSNTALTGSTALNAIRPVLGVGAATAATTSTFHLATEDTAGSLLVIPGNVLALSATVTGTAASIDAGIVWEEIAL